MRESIEMPKGTFYTIVAICAAIIMMTSMEMLIKAKDTDLFNMWLSTSNLGEDALSQTTKELFSTYLNVCISTFFIRVITPMAVAIHSYFTFTKLRVTKLFVAIWVVIIIGAFAFNIFRRAILFNILYRKCNWLFSFNFCNDLLREVY